MKMYGHKHLKIVLLKTSCKRFVQMLKYDLTPENISRHYCLYYIMLLAMGEPPLWSRYPLLQMSLSLSMFELYNYGALCTPMITVFLPCSSRAHRVGLFRNSRHIAQCVNIYFKISKQDYLFIARLRRQCVWLYNKSDILFCLGDQYCMLWCTQ